MADDPALRAALVARDSAAITALLELHGARLGVTESALLTPEFGASVADAPIRRRATDVVADSVDPRHATCILNMQSDPDDAKIVRSTIDLAHNLGLRVVAEGVESAQVWNLLRDLDCDQAQGHHMGRPMPTAEFHTWHAARCTR